MKKRILAICLVVAMAATAIVGASMAYLTDTDEAVNVMTLGNVQIEQKEQDREGNDFVQGQTLLPYVTLGATNRESVTVNGYTIQMRTKDSVGNYMDKIVTVTNTGKTDAYVRTLIAVPAALENNESASKNILHWNAVSDTDTDSNNGWMWDIENNKEWDAPVYATITVDGVAYNVYVATNKNVIKAGESTAPSLVGIYLDSKVDFDGINYTYDGTVIEGFDGQVNVLVLSQAVQTAGFSDAQTALDTAFGEVTDDNATTWFTGMSIPTAVSTADELAAALAAGGNVVLTADIEADSTFYVPQDVTVNLDLNGKTITVNSGHAFSLIGCNMTVKNGTIEAKNYYAFQVGSSINSISANLTIESGTFKGINTAVNLCYGTVTINGGYFESSVYTNGSYYTLNCIDRIYTAGNADMIVKGGTFYQFNPAENVSEGKGTNFCAEGYKVVPETDDNGITLYTVVAE